MSREDELDFRGDPRVPIADDVGDYGTPVGAGQDARMAPSTYIEGAPLPDDVNYFSRQFRTIGVVNVSDVIAPNRFRRVFQTVNIRNNGVYGGPTFVVFQTHASAIISEEIGMLAPGARPTVIPARTAATRTTPNAQITGARNGNQGAAPVIGREEIPATTVPMNTALGDRLGNAETVTSTVGNTVDIQELSDDLQGEDTDTGLSDLVDIARPRSSARTTVLQIRFKYPMMEAMGGSADFPMNTSPFTDPDLSAAQNFEQMRRDAALQNTYKPFTLFAGSMYGVEIPYPVGNHMPVHFDIINNNPIYSANVSMSALIRVERRD